MRLIFATHRDLEQEVRAGRFREDLYHRIAPFRVRPPPLRERVGDIALIAHHFVRLYAAREGKPIRGLAPRVLAALAAYPFPGNVRELEGMIRRAVIVEPSAWLQPKSLGLENPPQERPRLDDARVREVLARCQGHQACAAAALGIRRETLNRRVSKMRSRGAADGGREAGKGE